ncbi:MAG: nicotinate (nicotinamide) nucleotide adenylyltransferase [Lachnospiraceae bacterium]|nr:nicotinate (nicotinamide) nucleotide adenylyltransferase [Lachnospiraceae bacterium]
MNEKIALFGGTFDPFHKGHMELLENINRELRPDRIIIIPTGHPYMKERDGRKITIATDRVGMLRAGLGDAAFKWEISDIEVKKNSPSYSVETVEAIRDSLTDPENADLYFLCGSDVLFSIDTWYEYRKLLSCIILTVTPRGSDDLSRILIRKRELEEKEGARIIITEFKGREVSSSAIRDNIEACRDMLSEGTYEYIKSHHLYES